MAGGFIESSREYCISGIPYNEPFLVNRMLQGVPKLGSQGLAMLLSTLQAPPKLAPKTLESTRIQDETIVLPDDEEVLQDEKTDEFAGYFDRKTAPKVLIISVSKPSSKTHLLMRELKKCIPNSDIRQRWGIDLKKIIPQAVEREYTDVLVINEDRKVPNGLLIIHLPDGPTAHFKLTSFKRGYDIKASIQNVRPQFCRCCIQRNILYYQHFPHRRVPGCSPAFLAQ